VSGAGHGEVRPAFYALPRGGWRDYVTLLHPPYTAWHLSYVVVGACLAPTVSWSRLGWTLLAFALAVGVAAHALDELNGRPLGTEIPSSVLAALAAGSLAAACAIGIAGAVDFDAWLLAFVAVGAFLVLAYNLELGAGRLHTDLVFGLAWGGFPVLTGFFACAGELRVEAVGAAAWATLLSLAQRRLSTPVRHLRRRASDVEGRVTLRDGRTEPVTRETLVAAPEAALRLLTAATVALAVTIALFRL
jgi:heme O synthase-like polyprenyltransferase